MEILPKNPDSSSVDFTDRRSVTSMDDLGFSMPRSGSEKPSGMITFSTCWYIFKAKFDPSVYEGWIHNMLSNVNNYNLVVYCDTDGYKYIEPYLKNPRIMAIIKPYKMFSTYKYKQRWMKNHEENVLLNQRTDWRLNMLWSEKQNFVKETMDEHYFDSEWYGWCDIGYFRGRPNDSRTVDLTGWPSNDKISSLDLKGTLTKLSTKVEPEKLKKYENILKYISDELLKKIQDKIKKTGNNEVIGAYTTFAYNLQDIAKKLKDLLEKGDDSPATKKLIN